jgi:hypothetical protein
MKVSATSVRNILRRNGLGACPAAGRSNLGRVPSFPGCGSSGVRLLPVETVGLTRMYVLFFIELERRFVWLGGVTEHPTGEWVWRLELALRGWFTELVPIAIMADWIGESPDRAKLVARIAGAGEGHPSAIARHLLDQFGEIPEVGSALAGEYYSGSWVGNWSDRLALLIEQLKKWEADLSLPIGVRRWATQFASDLKHQRTAEVEREQERFR